jgi:hypothetical protein
MKGFDAAADFVSTHVNMIDKDESDHVHHIYLPEFLALIKGKGIVDSSCDDTISQINLLYNHLRHEMEVSLALNIVLMYSGHDLC